MKSLTDRDAYLRARIRKDPSQSPSPDERIWLRINYFNWISLFLLICQGGVGKSPSCNYIQTSDGWALPARNWVMLSQTQELLWNSARPSRSNIIFQPFGKPARYFKHGHQTINPFFPLVSATENKLAEIRTIAVLRIVHTEDDILLWRKDLQPPDELLQH